MTKWRVGCAVVLATFYAAGASHGDTCTHLTQPGGVKSFLDARSPNAGRCDDAADGSRSCRWAFALQDPRGREIYDALARRLMACAKSWEHDTGVNHPDSYLAITIKLEENALRLSLKDKAALDATYLFYTRNPGN